MPSPLTLTKSLLLLSTILSLTAIPALGHQDRTAVQRRHHARKLGSKMIRRLDQRMEIMERRDGGLMMIREQGNGMEMDVDVDVEKREWNPEIDGYWDAVDAILLAAAGVATPVPTSSSVNGATQMNLAILPTTTTDPGVAIVTQMVTAIEYTTVTVGIEASTTATSTSTISSSSSSSASSTSSASASAATTSTTFLSSVASTTTASTPTSSPTTPSNSTTSIANGKLVFAHFMVGISSQYAQSDWTNDMSLAQSFGIDGFALNIGTDPYTDTQLTNAYNAAAGLGFKVFLSFDFSYFNDGMVSEISAIINKYVGQSAQLIVGNGAAYVSTFIGDGFPWNQVISSTGKNLYVVPNWQPDSATAGDLDGKGISGLFSWLAWPSQNNQPIDQLMSSVGHEYDSNYMSVTSPASKTYMAPVSPWFFTHFPSSAQWAKNYIFLSETLWYDRWTQILAEQNNLEYLEIISWNDFGESHYVGSLDSPHTDDGSSAYANSLPHTALLDFAKPYIAAFKTGQSQPVITQDMLVYWYRPTLMDVSCPGDNVGIKPQGYQYMNDTVFVVSFATSPGQVTITSGSNAPYTKAVQSGVTMIEVPMVAGGQDFSMTTVLGANLSGKGGLDVIDGCWNGKDYNYNIYTGSIM